MRKTCRTVDRRSAAPAAGVPEHPDQRRARDRARGAARPHRTSATTRAAADNVVVTMRDTGPGIPAEVLPAHLRSVLHHQGGRPGHRTRPGDHLRDRPGARRHDHGENAPGRRRDLQRSSSRCALKSMIELTIGPSTMIDEGFLTTEEVLDYLQVNLRTVYRLIKAGKIPAVRVGRQWRFRKRDIDAWLESQRPRDSAHRAAAPRLGCRGPGRRPPAHPRRRRRGEHSRSAVEDARACRVRRRPRARRHAPRSSGCGSCPTIC